MRAWRTVVLNGRIGKVAPSQHCGVVGDVRGLEKRNSEVGRRERGLRTLLFKAPTNCGGHYITEMGMHLGHCTKGLKMSLVTVSI